MQKSIKKITNTHKKNPSNLTEVITLKFASGIHFFHSRSIYLHFYYENKSHLLKSYLENKK